MQKEFPVVEYVVYRETDQNWHINTRTIHNHELVFIVSGVGEISINQKKYTVKENDLVYFYPGLKHSLSVTQEPYMCFYGVHFSLSQQHQKLKLPELSNFQRQTLITSLLYKLNKAWKEQGYFSSWKSDLILSEIILNIYEDIQNQASPSNFNKITEVINYMHQNAHRPLSLEELCKLAGMGKTYFIKNFKQVTGCTPIDYSIRLRLQSSKAYLAEGGLNIKTVAKLCGFEDEFYYSKQFKKHFGIPPCKFIES